MGTARHRATRTSRGVTALSMLLLWAGSQFATNLGGAQNFGPNDLLNWGNDFAGSTVHYNIHNTSKSWQVSADIIKFDRNLQVIGGGIAAGTAAKAK